MLFLLFEYKSYIYYFIFLIYDTFIENVHYFNCELERLRRKTLKSRTTHQQLHNRMMNDKIQITSSFIMLSCYHAITKYPTANIRHVQMACHLYDVSLSSKVKVTLQGQCPTWAQYSLSGLNIINHHSIFLINLPQMCRVVCPLGKSKCRTKGQRSTNMCTVQIFIY